MAVMNGVNNQTGAIGDIAAGEDVRSGSLAVFGVDFDQAARRNTHIVGPAQRFQISLLADGHDDGIALPNCLCAWFELGVETAVLIKHRGHINHFQPGHSTVLPDNPVRPFTRRELNPLFQRFFNFKFRGRQFVPIFQRNHSDVGNAQTERGAGHVQRRADRF